MNRASLDPASARTVTARTVLNRTVLNRTVTARRESARASARTPWPMPRVLGVAVALMLAVTGCAPVGADAVAPPSVTGAPSAPAHGAPAATPEPAAPGAGTSPVPDSSPDSSPVPDASPDSSPPPAEPDVAEGTALAAVAELAVKGRAPRTGYDRDLFGPAWADVDHNGCDTRNDILARDLTDVVAKDGTQGCVVLAGTLADPYSGKVIAFERGQATSSAVQIDHVVALSDAWQKGAQQWDGETRRQFANDPLNLLAADGPLNQQKSDGDAATWLPPNKPFRCPYVARQVAVKRSYGLWVTQAERDAMVRVLSDCPGEPLPSGGPDAAPEPAPEPAAQPEQPVQPEQTVGEDNPAPADGGAVYFENCTAARAAGAAPLHTGDPGYRPAMDGDKDGVACE